MAVQKLFCPTGPISPLQKKPARPSGPNRCWAHLGVVIGLAKQALAAPVATAQAAAINRGIAQLLLGAREQLGACPHRR